METVTNKKEMINAKNANDLAEAVRKTLTTIESFVKDNDYVMEKQNLVLIEKSNLKDVISKLSLSKRKELRNMLWKIDKYPTLASVNRFLHFLMKTVLKSDFRIKVFKSSKQLAIEEKRKKYTDALAAAKKAHADYKTEKGDFYKSRLAKGLKH